MILYDASNLSEVQWADTPRGQFARSYLTPLLQHGVAAFTSDRSTLRLIQLDGLILPVAINDVEYDNSALFSNFSRYITLQLSGLSKGAFDPGYKWFASRVLRGLGMGLKAMQIDRCVYVDHWLLLRNMGTLLTADQVRRLTDFLVTSFPRHAIVFQAVNTATHAPLLNTLRESGYDLVYATHTRILLPYKDEVSRQARENRRRDARLLESAGYALVDGRDLPQCAPRLAELYRTLNGEKYSTNIQLKVGFFEAALRDATLQFRLAVKDGRIDGFYGYAVSEDVVFAPVFGYDLALPQKLGLYRGLLYHLTQDALDRGLAVELGGGADAFKSMRGDKPVPRYSAIYFRHLPAWRQAGWRLLQRLANGSLLRAAKGILREVDGDGIAGFDGVPSTFSAPTLTPREAAAQLRTKLDALERALEEASALEGEALARALTSVSDILHNWPQPTRRVLTLRERLERLEQRARRKPRPEALPEQVSPAEQARQLLEGAAGLGEASLVAHHLGDVSSQHLRSLVDCLRQAAGCVAVVLTATRGDKVVMVTAATPALLERGVDAVELMAQVAPAVGGKGGGSPEVTWGGGSRPDGVDAALAAARQFLEARFLGCS